jgi:transcriptional regulator with XRE-family HTH domain
MNEAHPLAKWLTDSKESRADFCERARISQSHLSLIISRKRGPSLTVAARIERATGKKVKAVDLLPLEIAQ